MARTSGTTEKSQLNVGALARIKAGGAVVALILAGSIMSILNAPIVSSAANSIEVMHISEAAPTDPQSELWERTQEVEVPLSAQQIYQPGGGSTRSVRVSALEDGQMVAIRVSWDDDSKNNTLGAVPSDAAAIQLPLDPAHLPYQCMGQSTSLVNIWQWKAALEQEGLDNLGAIAMQSAGIRNLTSNGICRAVDSPGTEPGVRSFHDGQHWNVVFYRALSKGDSGTAPLLRESNSSIAFAVWNGARGETRGMKAVSTWNTLLFQTPETGALGGLISLGVVIAVAAGAVAYSMRRLAA